MMKECPLARSSFEQWSFCQQAVPQTGQTLEPVYFEPKAGLRDFSCTYAIYFANIYSYLNIGFYFFYSGHSEWQVIVQIPEPNLVTK